MAKPVNICSLDYLTGTIATAYKGMITSLVAKDFCITEEGGEITLKGTILAMPEGRYQARLMREGSEFARSDLDDGYFALKTGAAAVAEAKNLQIDIVQKGRHIGTFLIKREKQGEFFVPASELSEELRGMDLKRLTARLRGKVGLLKKAEEIISKILSPKKDWRRFSEELNSFSSDVFWAERDTFCGSYPILARYSRLASEKLRGDKPLSNLLSLIELPMEKEEDNERLRGLVGTWLGELRGSAVDLTLRPNQSRRVLKSIHEKFPRMNIGFTVGMLVSSVEKKAGKMSPIEDGILDVLKGVLPESDYYRLAGYGEGKKKDLMRDISHVRMMQARKHYGELLEMCWSVHSSIPDEKDIAKDFFAILEGNMHPDSAGAIAGALLKALESFLASSPEISGIVAAGTAEFVRRLIGMGLARTCETFIRRMGSGRMAEGEDLLLDPEMAQVLLDAGDEGLLRVYEDTIRGMVIPAPGVSGFSADTWAEITNPLHIERLRSFLRIIGLDSVRFRDLLIHVICNLYIGDVLIPDESLFQREISAYLNSRSMDDNFLLDHLLLQRLPVYFSEVGATGRIRDYTTEIDAWGNDAVLYFLRKQVHVNASNYNIRLVVKIMECWAGEDTGHLEGAVPEDVVRKLDAGLLSRYSSAVRPLFRRLGLLEEGKLRPERLCGIKEEELRRVLEEIGMTDEIRTKILLLCRIYQEVVKKYSPVAVAADEDNIYESLRRHVEKMKDLKSVIFSPEKTKPEESLYFKRHIAFGIPSVMGSYHEPKFNAMGEFLRYEERIRVAFEKIAAGITEKKDDDGHEVLGRWISGLDVMNDLFYLLGLGNFQVDELVTIFRTNGLHRSQIADMLRLWRKELTWIVETLQRTFYAPLIRILEILPQEDLSGRLQGIDRSAKDFSGKAADIIIRDILSSLVGPVELDNVLDNLITFLSDPTKADDMFSPSGAVHNEMEFLPFDEAVEGEAMRLGPLIGTKAKNLVYLKNRDLPVPAGVVFPSRGADPYMQYVESAAFDSALRRSVKKIEEETGTSFVGRGKPLFLSVRSGSYISMPGILSSVLYCGMNYEKVDAFIAATGEPWTAWDSYRRFLFHYGTVVHGVDAGVFEGVTDRFLRENGVEKSEDLDAGGMEEFARLYLSEMRMRGLQVPENVYDQLKEAVGAVYGSWHSLKAVQFRKALKVSRHWGTSVTLMQMAPGNGRGAGASVFFTRDPSTLERGVFGETRERATGDDLVYGRLVNRPITKGQAVKGQGSLEEDDPELYHLHLDLAGRVEEAMGGLPQEVEAAYVRRRDGKRFIYVLQTRRMESHRGFTKSFSDICRMEESIIGRGAGVHGGALSGFATFTSSPDRVREMRRERNMPVILLRKTTSTDDVALMPEIDGILTSAGGVTSHAAILAQKFDLAAIVGCSEMAVETNERGEFYARIGDYTVTEGSVISIDGSTGLVYSGTCFLGIRESTTPDLA